MTALNKQALRDRYSPQPVPKCHICGAVMTIARASAGAVVYACSGCTYDDNGAHYAPGRSLGDDHYSASRVTIFESSDPEVLALLDELEAAESYAKDRDEENQDLMLTIGRLRVEREASEAELNDALCELLPGTQYMDPPDGGSVTPLEQVRRMVADYRERIEELESRTVTLPEPFKLAKSSSGLTYYYADEVDAAIQAAGIGVKGE